MILKISTIALMQVCFCKKHLLDVSSVFAPPVTSLSVCENVTVRDSKGAPLERFGYFDAGQSNIRTWQNSISCLIKYTLKGSSNN